MLYVIAVIAVILVLILIAVYQIRDNVREIRDIARSQIIIHR